MEEYGRENDEETKEMLSRIRKVTDENATLRSDNFIMEWNKSHLLIIFRLDGSIPFDEEEEDVIGPISDSDDESPAITRTHLLSLTT